MNASQKLLQNQLRKLKKEPVWGFSVDLLKDTNIYEWEVFIAGPPDSYYEGGIFRAILKFPTEYPYQPPVLQFTSKFLHPNVHKDGKVCISILHPPGDDPLSGERAEERWNPVQSPETILLSVITLLSDPNFSSPANVDSSIEWRKNNSEFQKKIKDLVNLSIKELPKDFEMPFKNAKVEIEQKIEIPNIYDDEDALIYDPDAEQSDEEEDYEGSEEEEDEEEKKEVKDVIENKETKENKEKEIKEKNTIEDIEKKEVKDVNIPVVSKNPDKLIEYIPKKNSMNNIKKTKKDCLIM